MCTEVWSPRTEARTPQVAPELTSAHGTSAHAHYSPLAKIHCSDKRRASANLLGELGVATLSFASMALNRFAALLGGVTGVSSLLLSGYIYREKKKHYEEEQKRYQEGKEREKMTDIRLKMHEFMTRYSNEVRPKHKRAKRVCYKLTDSRCKFPTQMFEFAVWFGKNRNLKKDDDDVVAVDDFRHNAVNLYKALMIDGVETIYPADGERYEFVTLVAALNQANAQLGHEVATYNEHPVFEYTLEKIKDPDMKKRAKECRHEVSQLFKEKAEAMTNAPT